MNKNIIVAVVTVVIVLGLIVGSGFAGYYYNEAEHANEVAALNKKIYEQGVALQSSINTEAETNRQLKIANKGRIDAIKINDHNNDVVRRLQAKLDGTVNELETLRTDYNYIVLDVVSINRVYDDARNECIGLADVNDAPIIPAPISQFTGDSVTGVVRYLVARYCEVATDYNGLYEHTERLIAGVKKPAR